MFKHVTLVDNTIVSEQCSARFIVSLMVVLTTIQHKELIDNKVDLPPLLHVTDKAVEMGDVLIDGEFVTPEAVKPLLRITATQMRDRFTFEERVKIDNSTVPEVVTFVTDLKERARPVDPKSPRFALAFALLLSLKYIDAGREIALASEPTIEEI